MHPFCSLCQSFSLATLRIIRTLWLPHSRREIEIHNDEKRTTTWAEYSTKRSSPDRHDLGDGDSCGEDNEELLEKLHFWLVDLRDS